MPSLRLEVRWLRSEAVDLGHRPKSYTPIGPRSPAELGQNRAFGELIHSGRKCCDPIRTSAGGRGHSPRTSARRAAELPAQISEPSAMQKPYQKRDSLGGNACEGQPDQDSGTSMQLDIFFEENGGIVLLVGVSGVGIDVHAGGYLDAPWASPCVRPPAPQNRSIEATRGSMRHQMDGGRGL